jgi:hypothetical protein
MPTLVNWFKNVEKYKVSEGAKKLIGRNNPRMHIWFANRARLALLR